ncbi:amidase signature enzyme [Aaosphaeria arxii CBS 175.79]|uniref:Amidase signature enzyme n=1 Tax=Aaosphaeria arxii CBS 175.79 TaxID=1450172 RepID=A0A6A5X942_9PLEO|nr:amidase signature enzyme [Aaosphaeria arxii CBS 175.79]KAF2009406.1 amidase signature enzyme [Aaosphaeria arxii CBS 175.79]
MRAPLWCSTRTRFTLNGGLRSLAGTKTPSYERTYDLVSHPGTAPSARLFKERRSQQRTRPNGSLYATFPCYQLIPGNSRSASAAPARGRPISGTGMGVCMHGFGICREGSCISRHASNQAAERGWEKPISAKGSQLGAGDVKRRFSVPFFAIVSAAAIMVCVSLRAFFVFAPLISNVVGQYGQPGVEIPSLLNATVEELMAGLEGNLFTSADLVNAYVGRILETNEALHAVTEINPDAWKIAEELDAERAAGKVRGPLHGLPILLKNNIATADLMNNTAGSYALLGAKTPRDSAVAEKLREAGAVILGKTNLSQWANFRSSNSSNGWSAHGGQVLGAYHPDQDPCGSSSGSGVAASIGLSAAAIGTETDGSVICPSQLNNIVGIKTTLGLVSRDLVIPISEHQDTVGPMARTVKDAAYVLQAIVGQDTRDNYTLAAPYNGTYPDYVAACSPDALSGARLGIPWQNVLYANPNPEIVAQFQDELKELEAAGAVLVNVTYTGWDQFVADEGNTEVSILYTDLKPNLASYLAQLTVNPENITTLADVINFTRTFPPEEYPDRNTINLDNSQAINITLGSAEEWAMYQFNQYLGGEGGLLGALERNNLTAVVLPSARSSTQSAIVGAPVVTVPLGAFPANTTVVRNARNLVTVGPNIPIGISFAGRLWSEAQLIGLAYAYEQRTRHREGIHPVIIPTTELEDVMGD